MKHKEHLQHFWKEHKVVSAISVLVVINAIII